MTLIHSLDNNVKAIEHFRHLKCLIKGDEYNFKKKHTPHTLTHTHIFTHVFTHSHKRLHTLVQTGKHAQKHTNTTRHTRSSARTHTHTFSHNRIARKPEKPHKTYRRTCLN
jgi:hypothetical protein